MADIVSLFSRRPGLGSDQQQWLDRCADMGAARVEGYRLYRDFYDGLRGALLRDRARKYLERHGVAFSENVCDLVVDALAERLRVIGFASDHPDVAAAAEAWWAAWRMDAAQATTHTETLIAGDEYAIVDWDEPSGRPRLVRQKPQQIKVAYSEDDQDAVAYAAKVWNTARVGPQNRGGLRVRRLNVYLPERIEKWYRPDSGGRGGGWERWRDTDDETWPVWWTTTGGEGGDPLGVPVVHFAHRRLGDRSGRSRIRPAIPYQEQLNKYVADLNDLVDNHSLPQDWVVGVAGDTTFKRVPGDLWHAAGETAKFGRLEATPTANLLDAIEGVLSRLARRSRVPMHLLTGGTPPSGEALKTAESGIASVARACHAELGGGWAQVMRTAVRLHNVFGDGDKLAEGATVEVQWANPETRSDRDDLEAATLKRDLGVSQRTLLAELGYDPEREAEFRAAEAAESQQALGAFLDRGGVEQ